MKKILISKTKLDIYTEIEYKKQNIKKKNQLSPWDGHGRISQSKHFIYLKIKTAERQEFYR